MTEAQEVLFQGTIQKHSDALLLLGGRVYFSSLSALTASFFRIYHRPSTLFFFKTRERGGRAPATYLRHVQSTTTTATTMPRVNSRLFCSSFFFFSLSLSLLQNAVSPIPLSLLSIVSNRESRLVLPYPRQTLRSCQQKKKKTKTWKEEKRAKTTTTTSLTCCYSSLVFFFFFISSL